MSFSVALRRDLAERAQKYAAAQGLPHWKICSMTERSMTGEGSSHHLGDDVGKAVKPGELWQGRTAAATGLGRGMCLLSRPL
jgi:hypothetical protein